jgi:hypothetical protein
MKRNRTARIIALFALALFSMVRVPSAFVWVCQGKVCGTTYGYCCCADRRGCDPQCGVPLNQSGAGTDGANGKRATSAFSNAGCDCQMLLQATDPVADPETKAVPIISAPLAILLPSVVFPEQRKAVVIDAVPRPDTRGPPALALRLSAAHSLRAPPVA